MRLSVHQNSDLRYEKTRTLDKNQQEVTPILTPLTL